jgi:hypothetical protein
MLTQSLVRTLICPPNLQTRMRSGPVYGKIECRPATIGSKVTSGIASYSSLWTINSFGKIIALFKERTCLVPTLRQLLLLHPIALDFGMDKYPSLR